MESVCPSRQNIQKNPGYELSVWLYNNFWPLLIERLKEKAYWYDCAVNGENIRFDFKYRTIDMADYRAFNAESPAFAAASLGHVLEEYRWAEKNYQKKRVDKIAFDPSHEAGSLFEMGVLSSFTRRQEKNVTVTPYPSSNCRDVQ